MDEKILIVMPAYNAEKTIGQAVSSILNQTFSNFTLVVVDDCSTDSTLEVLSMFSDKRLKVFTNKKNMGAYYCRNFGLYKFKNEEWTHFTTHDSDDISITSRYQKMINEFRRNHTVSGVQDTFLKKELRTKRQLGKTLTLAHAMFTRDVFESIGYFDDVRFAGDWEYWQRLRMYNSINNCRIKSIRTVMGYAYMHESNLTRLIPLEGSERNAYVEKVRQEIANNNRPMYKKFLNVSKSTKEVA